jgi:ribose 5-phosphate isomerase B
MKRTLVTEWDVENTARRGQSSMAVDPNAIITPSARDAARRHRIEIVSSGASQSTMLSGVLYMRPKDSRSPHVTTVIAVGSDHGGFELKGILSSYLLELGYSVADVGTTSNQPCDYPDFAYAVAQLVSSGQAEKGIMIDGVGVASAIVANKVPGVRAVPCYSEFTARSSREHNDANVLTLGGRVVGPEVAKSIVKVWLETWFGGGRHQQRVQKISDIEKRTMGGGR